MFSRLTDGLDDLNSPNRNPVAGCYGTWVSSDACSRMRATERGCPRIRLGFVSDAGCYDREPRRKRFVLAGFTVQVTSFSAVRVAPSSAENGACFACSMVHCITTEDRRRLLATRTSQKRSGASKPNSVEASRLIGLYDAIAEIALGGMGRVYLARRTDGAETHRLFAVKVIHERMIDDPEALNMLIDEANIASKLDHPNIVSILELGESNSRHFVVMDYVDGFPLHRLLKRNENHRPPRMIVTILLDGLRGLHAAHEMTDDKGRFLNLVHRDFAPDNLLIDVNGTCRVIDFGIAKISAQRMAQTQDGMHKGKLSYMSPEQLSAAKGIDRRADLWTAGVVLYEALSGVHPFKGSSPGATISNILRKDPDKPSDVGLKPPPFFDALIMRALRRSRGERYATAAQMIEELETIAVEHDLATNREEVAEWVRKTFKKDIATRDAILKKAGAAPLDHETPLPVFSKGSMSGSWEREIGVLGAIEPAAFEDDAEPSAARAASPPSTKPSHVKTSPDIPPPPILPPPADFKPSLAKPPPAMPHPPTLEPSKASAVKSPAMPPPVPSPPTTSAAKSPLPPPRAPTTEEESSTTIDRDEERHVTPSTRSVDAGEPVEAALTAKRRSLRVPIIAAGGLLGVVLLVVIVAFLSTEDTADNSAPDHGGPVERVAVVGPVAPPSPSTLDGGRTERDHPPPAQDEAPEGTSVDAASTPIDSGGLLIADTAAHDEVNVRLIGVPEEAEVRLDGELVDDGTLRVPVDDTEHIIRVEAPRCRPWIRRQRFTRDLDFEVRLRRQSTVRRRSRVVRDPGF